MSDKMPDYEPDDDFDYQGIDPADLGAHFTDAMQALTTRNAVSKAACAQLIAEQAQRAEEAEADRMRAWEHLQRTEFEFQQTEAERDRLRAALERLMRGEGGVNSLEQERIAQEALDHD